MKLFDHAEKVGGTLGAASGTFTFEDNGIAAFDRVTLWYQNLAFDHIVSNPPGGDPLGAAIDDIRDLIKNRDWTADSPFALRADRAGGNLTIKAARAGRVDTNGTTVTWVSGAKFPGIAGSSTIRINQVDHTVSTVDSPTQITLRVSPARGVGANRPFVSARSDLHRAFNHTRNKITRHAAKNVRGLPSKQYCPNPTPSSTILNFYSF